MKAVWRDRYGPPEVLDVVEIPTPQPRHEDVLVKVEATSINTADLDHLLGRPRIARIGTGWRRPRWGIPGLDVAGTVAAVGPAVTRYGPGDEVWADLFSSGQGAFAEYVCASQDVFTPKPAQMPFATVATVPHSGLLALQALQVGGGVEAGHQVLINGGGGCVGPFAIQIARASGAEVTAVDTGARVGVMREAGADHVVDFVVEDITRGSTRFDVVLDIAANRSPLAFKRVLARQGRYVQISRTLGGFVAAALVGAVLGGSRKMGVFAWKPNSGPDLSRMTVLLEEGWVAPVVDSVIGLAGVPAALRRLGEGDTQGKVIVKPE
jgi:NADPH:quinone reductase-like Zn-dependent oxidoreductase